MATPRTNSEQARKRHEGINKICTRCNQPFYDNTPQKKTRHWCDACIRLKMEGKLPQ